MKVKWKAYEILCAVKSKLLHFTSRTFMTFVSILVFPTKQFSSELKKTVVFDSFNTI